MQKLKKYIHPKLAFLIGVYLFMLVLNILTPMLVDDYTYCYSFVDGSKIESVFDIFPSILAHAQKMNGRHVAHFFAQLFLFLPQIIFKLINPAVFCALIYIIARMASNKSQTKLMALAFGLIFIFQPAFGQVNLWLDGACNYLFSYTVCLLWLLPFFDEAEDANRPFYLKIAIILLGFLAGGWNENVSAATIIMAALAIGLAFFKGKKVKWELYLSVAAAAVGFLLMALAPAEAANKISELDFGMIRENFVIATTKLSAIFPLICLYVILLTASFVSFKVTHKNLFSLILGIGALASNYIMIFATYYHDRSASYTTVLFVAGCVILASEAWETGSKKIVACTISLTLVITAYFAVVAVNDIYLSYRDATANENYLIFCHESGADTASIPQIHAATKYSAANGLKYIDTNDPHTWPNHSMAKYFGISEITGK